MTINLVIFFYLTVYNLYLLIYNRYAFKAGGKFMQYFILTNLIHQQKNNPSNFDSVAKSIFTKNLHYHYYFSCVHI